VVRFTNLLSLKGTLTWSATHSAGK